MGPIAKGFDRDFDQGNVLHLFAIPIVNLSNISDKIVLIGGSFGLSS